MSRKPRVLIIDDDEFLRKGLKHALEKLGVEPVLTGDPDRFLSLVLDEGGAFDLHLIGLHLSDGRSGLDLAQKARSALGSRARIMMLSTSGDPELIAQALRSGANDYLLKPLDRMHLASKLARYFVTPQMSQSGEETAPWSAPEGRSPGRLKVFGDIVEVEERGVKILSPHLLPKGTLLELSGSLVQEITGRAVPAARGVPLKVISSWAEVQEGATIYGAYAEFDRSRCDLRWFRNLRKWLGTRPPEGPSAE